MDRIKKKEKHNIPIPTRKLGSLERQSFLNHLVLPVGPSMSAMDIAIKVQQYLYRHIQRLQTPNVIRPTRDNLPNLSGWKVRALMFIYI
jgi:hypothetical protein